MIKLDDYWIAMDVRKIWVKKVSYYLCFFYALT